LLMESDAELAKQRLDVVIGLGANVGEPRTSLLRALEELAHLGELAAISHLYKTLPVGGPPQPDFLNAAARLQFRGSPAQLLGRLLAIEIAAGRHRRERWGPRSLDLDILWVQGVQLSEPGLEIPHPRLRQRAFALRPLVDVAPEATDPADGALYARLLEELGCEGVEDLGNRWVGAGLGAAAPGMDRPCP
jgi:2-amino-4-hydroxy-6-hydroxymethyldihydropteridine diphosphokinase